MPLRKSINLQVGTLKKTHFLKSKFHFNLKKQMTAEK